VVEQRHWGVIPGRTPAFGWARRTPQTGSRCATGNWLSARDGRSRSQGQAPWPGHGVGRRDGAAQGARGKPTSVPALHDRDAGTRPSLLGLDTAKVRVEIGDSEPAVRAVLRWAGMATRWRRHQGRRGQLVRAFLESSQTTESSPLRGRRADEVITPMADSVGRSLDR